MNIILSVGTCVLFVCVCVLVLCGSILICVFLCLFVRNCKYLCVCVCVMCVCLFVCVFDDVTIKEKTNMTGILGQEVIVEPHLIVI